MFLKISSLQTLQRNYTLTLVSSLDIFVSRSGNSFELSFIIVK